MPDEAVVARMLKGSLEEVVAKDLGGLRQYEPFASERLPYFI